MPKTNQSIEIGRKIALLETELNLAQQQEKAVTDKDACERLLQEIVIPLSITIQEEQYEQKESHFSGISTEQLILLEKVKGEASELKRKLTKRIENFYNEKLHKNKIKEHQAKVESLKTQLTNLKGVISSVDKTNLGTVCKNILDIQQKLALTRGILDTEMNEESQKLVKEIVHLGQEAQNMQKQLDDHAKQLAQDLERKEEEHKNAILQEEWRLLKPRLEEKLAQLRDKIEPHTKKELDEILREIAGSCTEISEQRAKLLSEFGSSSWWKGIEQELIALRTNFETCSENLKENFEARKIAVWKIELEALTKRAGSNASQADLTQMSSRAASGFMDDVCETTKATLHSIAAFSEKVQKEFTQYEGELSEASQLRRNVLIALQKDSQDLKVGLERVYQRQQDQKETTFAGYRFQRAGDESRLLENEIYISADGMCRGISSAPERKLYEKKLTAIGPEPLDEQLRNPRFQRTVLNELAHHNYVSYSLQQDWEFFLENLCAALNAVKDSISDSARNDKFHAELSEVGIFYEREGYVLQPGKAEKFIRYKDYICNTDSLIAAGLDTEAGQDRNKELKKLHAAQFLFSPFYPDVKNVRLEDAIREAQQFYVQVFQPKLEHLTQEMMIEEDTKYLEVNDNDVRAQLQQAQAGIKERKMQLSVLDEAYKRQQNCVKILTVSEEILQEENKILNQHNKLESELQEIIAKEKSIPTINQKEIESLGGLLNKINEQNAIDEAINQEKSAREMIRKAIDSFVATDERFTSSPSIVTLIFRSSRSAQLAKSLESVKKDIEKSNVTMSYITGQLLNAIEVFESRGDKNSALTTLQDAIGGLADTQKNSKQRIDTLLQQRHEAVDTQNRIMNDDIVKLKQKIKKNDDSLQTVNAKKLELQKEIVALKPQVEKIQSQVESRSRIKERAEANLVRLQEIRKKSRQGRLQEATDIALFDVLLKEVKEKNEDFEGDQQAIVQRKNEMGILQKSKRENTLDKVGFFRAFQFSRLCVGLGEAQPIEQLQLVEPLQNPRLGERYSIESLQIKK